MCVDASALYINMYKVSIKKVYSLIKRGGHKSVSASVIMLRRLSLW